MRKSMSIFIILIVSFSKSFSQTPFTTLVKEPRFLEKTANDNRLLAIEEKDSANVKLLVDRQDSTFGTSVIEASTKNDFDFFKSSAFSLNILNKGENRISVSSQVLFYKLYIANPTDDNKYRLNRYNIPLMLISKLSTNYDSTYGSSAVDVLDYEAAPVTLRIMPSIKKSFRTYNDVFYFGFYTDLRGINLSNLKSGTNDIEFVGSGGIGLTYQGDGKAGTYNSNGEYEAGRYSISIIFQAASGKKEVISKLFATENNYVTSFQGYFVFKISDKSKLNLKAGYQHFFQETIGGIKNNFSIAIGM
jgi:hypothetical protein